MNDKIKVTDSASNQPQTSESLAQSLTKADWQKTFPTQSNQASEPNALVFDNNIYSQEHGPLAGQTLRLHEDVQVLSSTDKGSAAYNAALSDLSQDEQALRTGVFALRDQSSNFQSFSGVMESYHSELKSIATSLWHMGLKDAASDTTAYYPLSHYEKYFTNKGTGSGDGSPPADNPNPPTSNPNPPADNPNPPPTEIPGGQVFDNLQTLNWKHNTTASEIGGSGKVQGMEITPGQVMDYSSQMGAYGDTLGSVSEKVSPSAKTFQLNYQFNPSTNTFQNTQCLENDMVITDNNGKQAVAGSQFNLKEKAPDGMCWFQTWDTQKGQWENAALVPAPKAGQFNDVSMTVKLNGDGTYTYSPLTYDGQTYNLQNNTFNMKSSNWTRNEVVVQVQEDAGSHGGPVDEQYTNMQLVAG